MGAYGSPELYPFDNNEKPSKSNKNSYVSKYSIATYVLCIVIFTIFYFAGGRNKGAFATSLFITAVVSLIANIFAMLLCKIKKAKNNFYTMATIVSIIIALFAFVFFAFI